MSNDTQKADQIAHHLYSKLALVVNHARATADPPPTAKFDKWFNLEIPDPELFKEHTRIYRAISSAPTIPVFRLQVLLSIPELVSNQVLVHHAPDSSRVRIEPAPRYIVLETWSLDFTPHGPHYDHTSDVQPSTMYKYSITLFRSIYTLLHVLPAWKLSRRLRRRVGGNRNGNFSIRLRVDDVDASIHRDHILDLDTPLSFSPSAPPLDYEQQTLPPITHPAGEFSVTARYLTAPDFQLDTAESLLSADFLSLEEGPEFTPTLVRNQQRESLSGSPGSLPLRTSLPRSPPRSVAERFVIPPPTTTHHARTSSFSSSQAPRVSPNGSPRLGNIPLPISRNLSGAGMGTSGVSDSSSSRQGASMGSRDEVSSLAARMRRESLQGRGADSPLGVPIRRQPLPTVNPFKSSTISSGSPSLHSPSPSLRQSSPLAVGTGPSLPSRPAQSPTSSRLPSSPTTGGGNFASSPVTPFRPSPPFVPSNLGSGRPTSAEFPSISPTGLSNPSPRMQGKRYSSSFGTKYTPAGAPGEASPKGSPRNTPKDLDKPQSTSFMSNHTDDDDISAFVQDIDARKPLPSRRDDSPGGSGSSASPSPSAAAFPSMGSSPSSLPRRTPLGPALRDRTVSASGMEPVLTTEDAVDERLREMNENFFASLQGLGSGSRRRPGMLAKHRAGRQSAQTIRRPPLGSFGPGRRESPLGSGGSGVAEPDSASGSEMGSGVAGLGIGGVPLPLPRQYVRARVPSTGSVRSGFSVASEEVIGRMDPEVSGSGERRVPRGP
ncbi:autophagy-related protein 13-domain-containing protein [Epithele typhae]|uniref:autophagy-related protein 13-domain-containing protein n=1 Tax=Epithele typhae TaxID=378194 RepID=UPI0020076AA2|nr:autophagy-related protein 13-domain-containing protein [Epithele typhae]KAH9919968.1 autophagy-related protein 13-domain-containing protein [Epithele typhae]